VLNPGDRIAFDLVAPVNASAEYNRWTIWLPPGEYDVRYVFEVEPGAARYDYLGKGSRFADQPPRGSVRSSPTRYECVCRLGRQALGTEGTGGGWHALKGRAEPDQSSSPCRARPAGLASWRVRAA
jgi:hypothetical protein